MAKSFADNLASEEAVADQGQGNQAVDQGQGEQQDQREPAQQSGQQQLEFDDQGSAENQGQGEQQQPDQSQARGEQQAPSLLDRIRGMGFEVDDEQQALSAMVDRFERTQPEIERIVREYNDLQRQNREWQQWATSQRQQPAPEPQKEQQSPWRTVKPLQVPQKVLDMYRDDSGRLRPDTPPEVVQEVARYEQENLQWFSDAMTNPEEFFGPGIESVVNRMLDERLQQHDRQRDTRTEYQRANDEVAPVIFEISPVTGERQLTEVGDRFYDAWSENINFLAREFDLDPDDAATQQKAFMATYRNLRPLIQQARQLANGSSQAVPTQQAAAQQNQGQQQAQQSPTAEELRENRRRQHMRQGRAAGVSQAGGGAATPDDQRRERRTAPGLRVGESFGSNYFGSG